MLDNTAAVNKCPGLLCSCVRGRRDGDRAILSRMRWWRHSLLARVVATVILLWTAADLTNASLCALDSDEFGPSAAVAFTPTVSDSPTDQAPQPAPHIDDCFCCSHCVDVQVLAPAIATAPIARREPPAEVTVPDGFGFPLYHPPLA